METSALALAAALTGLAPVPQAVPPVPKTAAVQDVPQTPASQVLVASPSGAIITQGEFSAVLSRSSLVAVGEKHDSPAHHSVQAEVLAQLAELTPKLVVGFEMVSYEDQAKLDDFASDKTSEGEFAAWWKKNWGFDYSLYKPVFDEARKRHLPMYGLNAPISLVTAVAKKGLSGLSAAERARLPEKIEESSDARYREFVLESVSSHGAAAQILLSRLGIDAEIAAADPAAIERRIQAMAVWNETMGEQAARRAAGKTLFLVAGQGHVLYKAGVPESAARRGVKNPLVLLPYPFDDEPMSVPDMLARLRDPASGELEQADIFRLVP